MYNLNSREQTHDIDNTIDEENKLISLIPVAFLSIIIDSTEILNDGVQPGVKWKKKKQWMINITILSHPFQLEKKKLSKANFYDVINTWVDYCY